MHKPNELVDILLIDHNLTVAESRQQNYTGIYGFVTMNLTISVFCEGNFSGSDCTQCVSGFTGPDCNETDHCLGVDCSGNGECRIRMDVVDNFHCVCDPGFTGELCQTNMCGGVDCNGNEECTPGFSGPPCSSEGKIIHFCNLNCLLSTLFTPSESRFNASLEIQCS